MDKKLLAVLIGGALVGLALLGTGGYLLLSSGGETAVVSPTAPAVAQITETTVAVEASPTLAVATATLPAPAVQLLPSNTPPPTITPAPTNTPAPTETPSPEPTATPIPPTAVPVVVQPTAVPPTAVPPTAVPTAVPSNARGLTGTLSIEGGPSFGSNQEIWFNFNVSNSSGGDVPFSVLGVYPRKSGTLRPDYIQPSWGGNPSDAVSTSGLVWRDNIKLGESGSYTLQLAVCFDASYQTCRSGGGTWAFISGEIPVTIN